MSTLSTACPNFVFKSFDEIYPNLDEERLRNAISRVLTAFRVNLFRTQKSVSEPLEVSEPAYQDWETGKRLMDKSRQPRARKYIHQTRLDQRSRLTHLASFASEQPIVYGYFEDVYSALYEGYYDRAIDRADRLLTDESRFLIDAPKGHDIWIRNRFYKCLALEGLAIESGYDASEIIKCTLDECIAAQPEDDGLYFTIQLDRDGYLFAEAEALKSAQDLRYVGLGDQLLASSAALHELKPKSIEPLWNRATVASYLLESEQECKRAWDAIINHDHFVPDQLKKVTARQKRERVMESTHLSYLAKVCDL